MRERHRSSGIERCVLKKITYLAHRTDLAGQRSAPVVADAEQELRLVLQGLEGSRSPRQMPRLR